MSISERIPDRPPHEKALLISRQCGRIWLLLQFNTKLGIHLNLFHVDLNMQNDSH